MKPSDNTSSCRNIRDLLDENSPEQLLPLETHLRACADCRAYRDTLRAVSFALSQPPEPGLTPNPDTHRTVRSRLRAHRPPAPDLFLYPLSTFFKRRIPVYQALAAAAAVLIVFLTLERSVETRTNDPIPAGAPSPAAPSQDTMLSLNTLDSQKIGRTIGEDSLLTKYTIGVPDTFFAGGNL